MSCLEVWGGGIWALCSPLSTPLDVAVIHSNDEDYSRFSLSETVR